MWAEFCDVYSPNAEKDLIKELSREQLLNLLEQKDNDIKYHVNIINNIIENADEKTLAYINQFL